MEKRPQDRDELVDGERQQGEAEEYKPGVGSDDENVDYESRTHGDTRRI